MVGAGACVAGVRVVVRGAGLGAWMVVGAAAVVVGAVVVGVVSGATVDGTSTGDATIVDVDGDSGTGGGLSLVTATLVDGVAAWKVVPSAQAVSPTAVSTTAVATARIRACAHHRLM